METAYGTEQFPRAYKEGLKVPYISQHWGWILKLVVWGHHGSSLFFVQLTVE